MDERRNGRADAVHFGTLVIDSSQSAPMAPEHFARLRRGGVNVVNYTTVRVTSGFAEAALDIASLWKIVEAHPDEVMVVKTGSDLRRARAEGRIGIIIGLQNGRPIMDNLDHVRLLHMLGVRIVQLTYNERNLIGDGCIEPANGGLSRLGRQVVAEMNRRGIMIDVAHCGERTTLDAIEESEEPVAITHANARALCPSVRNKSDVVLKRLAERGGAIGAAFWGPLAYGDPDRRPTLKEHLDHVEYLVEHAGIDHVGIGSDLGQGESRELCESMFLRGAGIYPEVTQSLGAWYTFDGRMIEGLESAVAFPRVSEGLLVRGYGEEDIRKILAGNFQRIMSRVFDRGPAD